MIWGIFHFLDKLKFENIPNRRGNPLKKFKKYIFQKSKCTHFSSINLKGKVSDSKNIVRALVFFCSYPCGTPCIYYILYILGTWRHITSHRHSVTRIAAWSKRHVLSILHCSDIFHWNRNLSIVKKNPKRIIYLKCVISLILEHIRAELDGIRKKCPNKTASRI